MNLYVQIEEAGIIEILPVDSFMLKKDFNNQSYKLMAKKDVRIIELKDFKGNKDEALRSMNNIFNDIKNSGITGRTSFIWSFENN